MDFSQLVPFATERQREVIAAVAAHDSQTKAAEALGVSGASISQTLKAVRLKAMAQGFSPEHDMTHPAPETHIVKGVSTLYGDDGQVKQQWVKTSIDDMARQAQQEAALEALKADLPKYSATEYRVRPTQSDLANLFVLTDYHFGMLAWGEETRDEDWDVSIAEQLIVDWVATAIRQAPPAKQAILCNLGDFLHFDGMLPITPSHGHILDADSRYQKVVRVAVRALRKCIDMMLETYPSVHLIMATGNHDLAGSVWLRELFSNVYADEPRLTVDLSADPYYAFEWGSTSLFFHHGHKKKLTDIDDVFARKFRKLWGNSEHSYAHMGHLHHIEMKETNLMVVEQHRTLAAADAHASGGGWLSGRSAKVITYHKQYGEVANLTISPEVARASHDEA